MPRNEIIVEEFVRRLCFAVGAVKVENGLDEVEKW